MTPSACKKTNFLFPSWSPLLFLRINKSDTCTGDLLFPPDDVSFAPNRLSDESSVETSSVVETSFVVVEASVVAYETSVFTDETASE